MDFSSTEISHEKKLRSVFDLSFYEFNNNSPLSTTYLHEKLFKFWKTSWEKSYTELGVEEKMHLFGDDFLSKRILSFFHKDNPIGCIFLEHYNLDSYAHRSTRYLQNFPTEAIEALKEKGFSNVYAISNLTIDHEWRKRNTDLSVSQILTSIGTWLACQERGDAIISCVRNDRSVNKLFQNHNSKTIVTDRRFNCKVDFIYIDLKEAYIFPTEDIMKASMFFLSGNEFVRSSATA